MPDWSLGLTGEMGALACQMRMAVGTIALSLGDPQEYPHVQLLQVTGVNNSEPPPDLIDLAWSLAGAWGTASQLTCWGAYTEQCARWLRMTGAGALLRS